MKQLSALAIAFLLLVPGCTDGGPPMTVTVPRHGDASTYQQATFAGGCFWCMEPPFEKLDGVHDVVSGYTGGFRDNPIYKHVAMGATGHYEAVQITFDPARISYEQLLTVFWAQINPTDDGGSFVDRGQQYSSAIF